MKNRNLILSVLLWAVCSSLFAVTLPTSSYIGAGLDSYNDSYTLVTGTSVRNTAVLYAYETGTCTGDNYNKDDLQQYDACNNCCYSKLRECAKSGRSVQECEQENLACKNDCNGASLPLGTPLMLLPFIAVYAFIRKRKQS